MITPPKPTAAAVAVLAVLLACAAPPAPARSEPPAQPVETPIRGGRLVEALTADVRTLQPILSADPVSAKAISLLYASLARLDARTGAPLPDLGSWHISADGRTYSWVIAADAIWSDGRPIVAEDFAITMEVLARSKAGRAFLRERIVGFAEFRAGSADSISGIQVDPADPKRMSVTLTSPVCQALVAIFVQTPLLPAHVFGRYAAPNVDDAIDRAAENDAPEVVSGPFVLGEWRRGERLLLRANASYWKGAPLLDEYELKVVGRANLVEQLRSGAVDLFDAPTADEVLAIETIHRTSLHRTLDRGFTGIAWDTRGERQPALRDKRVRQALAHALDWSAVIRAHLREGVRNNAHHSPSHWIFAAGLPTYGYDPARAEALLRAAGYARGPDGVFAREGRQIELHLVTNEGNPVRAAILQLARDQFAAIGVSATVERLPFAQLVSRARNGEAFDGWVLGWTIPPGDSDSMQAWHSGSIPAAGKQVGVEGAPPANFARFASDEVDGALESFTRGPDCSLATRRAAHANVNRILNEEQPWDFGVIAMRYTAAPRELRGLVPSVHVLYEDVHRWWLARSIDTR